MEIGAFLVLMAVLSYMWCREWWIRRRPPR